MSVKQIAKDFDEKIKNIKNEKDLENLRVSFLGRKGFLTEMLKNISSLTVEEKKTAGKELNLLKNKITEELNSKKNDLEGVKLSEIDKESIDITAPGSTFPKGNLHPVTLIFDELFTIFRKLGFSIAEGPEIESDWYNFESLNFPKDHPARDTQDTLFIDDEVVLRTQTSSVQVRFMEANKPPIRVVAPGRVYRRDSDVTHTPMFHQLEGLVVDKGITFADLKGTLEHFAKELYGADRKLRFRPHYFPFTEPSAEIDVSCGICDGKGCRSCKHTGWLEILGAGMVHPNVLKNGGISPEEYSGFAFGLGIERMAMLKFGIDDIRLLYEGDLRFNKQF